MNSCDKKQLTLWAAGVLDSEAARACEQHLDQCAACQTQYAAIKEIAQNFASHAKSLPPARGANGLHRSLQARLQEEAEMRASVFWLRRWSILTAIATASVTVLLVWIVFQKRALVSPDPQLV